jgi:hypothetical protein
MQDGYLLADFVDNGALDLLDRHLARLEGHRMVLAFDDGRRGESVYHWHRSGDTLRFTFLRTTDPTHDGIPAEVYQRALYTTAPFHHVG